MFMISKYYTYEWLQSVAIIIKSFDSCCCNTVLYISLPNVAQRMHDRPGPLPKDACLNN